MERWSRFRRRRNRWRLRPGSSSPHCRRSETACLRCPRPRRHFRPPTRHGKSWPHCRAPGSTHPWRPCFEVTISADAPLSVRGSDCPHRHRGLRRWRKAFATELRPPDSAMKSVLRSRLRRSALGPSAGAAGACLCDLRGGRHRRANGCFSPPLARRSRSAGATKVFGGGSLFSQFCPASQVGRTSAERRLRTAGRLIIDGDA